MSQHIKEQVLAVVDVLENPPPLDDIEKDDLGYDEQDDAYLSAWDFITFNALDIEYIISSEGNYLGARVLVAFGGPTIWVNTRTEQVEGGWWADTCNRMFKDNIGLDDVCREMYECI